MPDYDLSEAIDLAGRAKGELEPNAEDLQAAIAALLEAVASVGERVAFATGYDRTALSTRWQTSEDVVTIGFVDGRIVCCRHSDRRTSQPKICFNSVTKMWEEAEYSQRGPMERPRRSAVAIVVEEVARLLRAHP